MPWSSLRPSSTTHLWQSSRASSDRSLGRAELSSLLDVFCQTTRELGRDLVPNLLFSGEVLKVMSNLLRESVSIRDLRAPRDALLEAAPNTRDPEPLTELILQRRSHQPTAAHRGSDVTLARLILDPAVVALFRRSLSETVAGTGSALDAQESAMSLKRVWPGCRL
jgi:flagellar biosynthesis protein FlhA